MKILGIRRLRGPNVHLSRPAIVARLRLDALTGRETSDVTGFPERLLRTLSESVRNVEGISEWSCGRHGSQYPNFPAIHS